MTEAASRVDFVTKTNTISPFALVLEDGNGAAIDLSGSSLKLSVKARDAAGLPTGDVLLTLESGSGITGDLEQGEIDIAFPAEADDGLAAGAYVYDCLRIDGGVAVECLFVGTVDVEAGITEPPA